MNEDRLEKFEKVLRQRQPDITLILENIFDPLNVAAVMRSCDSIGMQEIYVLNTQEPHSTYKIKKDKKSGHKTSRGTVKWLDVHSFDNLDACISAVRKKYSRILATHLNADAKDLYEIDFTSEPTAIIFGNEHFGITEELLQAANGNFVIPQMGHCQSLNISVACAVTMYEALRQKRAAGHYANMRLDVQDQNRLELAWKMKYKK